MTRRSATLFCLALWTLVPGCLQLPWRSGAAPEGPTKFENPVAVKPADTPGPQVVHSTASVTDPVPSREVRSPQELAYSALPVLIQPPDLGLPPLEGEGTKKPLALGVSGEVEIAPGPTSKESVPAIFQAILPPGETKFPAWVRAIDHLQNDRHNEALLALRDYDEPTQEFFLRIFPVLVQIAKTSIKDLSPQQIANLNAQLVGLLEQLRTRSELLVNKMVYCKEINGFANYVSLPDDHVFLSRGELVQVYVELRNFASVKTKEGDYLTKLTCSLEVYDKNDKRVAGPWIIDKNETTYRRSACVNDYYGNYSFYVPALPEGTYRLAIQIVDETIPEHRRVARQSLAFRVTPVANPLSSR
jgi:hypothetical protein